MCTLSATCFAKANVWNIVESNDTEYGSKTKAVRLQLPIKMTRIPRRVFRFNYMEEEKKILII